MLHAKMMIGGRPHVDKCNTCRKRKVKCGREKPKCNRCVASRLFCDGYEKKIQSRDATGLAQQGHSQIEKLHTTERTEIDGGSSSLSDNNRNYKRGGISPSTVFIVPRDFKSLPGIISPSPKSQYKIQLLHKLQQSCVPIVNGAAVCVSWIVAGCSQASRQDEGPLSDALMATAVRTLGGVHKDHWWSINAFQLYQRALGKLRVCLRHEPTGQQQDLLALTSFACVMFEVSVSTSFTETLQHMRGLGVIFHHRGVQAFSSTVSRHLFCEYRAFNFPLRLIERRANFLSSEDWINPPWKPDHPHMLNPLQSLLDCAFHLPPLLEKFDSQCPSDDQAASRLYGQAVKIPLLLEEWETNLLQQNGGELYSTPENDTTPISWSFRTFPIATALLYKETLYVHYFMLLAMLHPRTSVLETKGQRFEELMTQAWSCMQRICYFFEYFFEPDKKRTGRTVFFLLFQVALRGLPSLGNGSLYEVHGCSEQRSSCRDVCWKLEEQGFSPWDLCQHRWMSLKMEGDGAAKTCD